MANRFMGFARLFSSSAKNFTRKEGFLRMFSSTAGKSTKNHKIFGDVDYDSLTDAQRMKIINRHVYFETITRFSTGVAIGLTLGCLYGYFSIGWYPFKDTFEGKENYRNHALRLEKLKLQARNSKNL
ncbi:hypothetical protein MKX03_005636 [Papaver bracteatum]|nr:hypothetical protein MKX03_005636 [Papaver bracteatum]